MKLIDQKADINKFWFDLGEMRVTDAVRGKSDEVVIEVTPTLAEALSGPGAAAAGQAAFQCGVNKKLDEAIAARAPWVKAVLAAYVEVIPPGKITVRPEKRTLKRKTVEAFDAEGRILSMLEEEIRA
jgi:hypothetical protein